MAVQRERKMNNNTSIKKKIIGLELTDEWVLCYDVNHDQFIYRNRW